MQPNWSGLERDLSQSGETVTVQEALVLGVCLMQVWGLRPSLVSLSQSWRVLFPVCCVWRTVCRYDVGQPGRAADESARISAPASAALRDPPFITRKLRLLGGTTEGDRKSVV